MVDVCFLDLWLLLAWGWRRHVGGSECWILKMGVSEQSGGSERKVCYMIQQYPIRGYWSFRYWWHHFPSLISLCKVSYIPTRRFSLQSAYYSYTEPPIRPAPILSSTLTVNSSNPFRISKASLESRMDIFADIRYNGEHALIPRKVSMFIITYLRLGTLQILPDKDLSHDTFSWKVWKILISGPGMENLGGREGGRGLAWELFMCSIR